MSTINHSEIGALVNLSARLGRDLLLVQASSGNTSVKVGGVMWIKASGKWLIDAEHDDILIPIDLEEARGAVRHEQDVTGSYLAESGMRLRPSIETAMHAVIPHQVAVHVHSSNTVAWAVRQDGCAHLSQRLAGLRWQWIPYVCSGLPLAQAIQQCVSAAPDTDVFVLANHGLVVCGNTCEACENLLQEVERRLAIHASPTPEPNCHLLGRMSAGSGWRLPEVDSIHGLGTIPLCTRIISNGVLYPCQAIFLAGTAAVISREHCAGRAAEILRSEHQQRPFVVVEGSGVLVNESITRAETEMLVGLSNVTRRLDAAAPIRYLSEEDLQLVLTDGVQSYRQFASASCHSAVFRV